MTPGLPEFLVTCVEQDERDALTSRDRAECQVKRELLKIHRRNPERAQVRSLLDHCEGCGYEGFDDWPITERIDDCPVLRILTLPYVDRPGYTDKWAPE